MSPLTYSKAEKGSLFFSCSDIEELVQKPTLVSDTAVEFTRSASMEPLFASLVVEGSTGIGPSAAPSTFRCSRGDCSTELSAFGDYRTHIGGHFLK